MAKHRARMLRARAESLENMAAEFKQYADELETQGLAAADLEDGNPGEMSDPGEPKAPWETDDFCNDFLTFYRLEVSKPTGLPRPMNLNATRKAKIMARKLDKLLVRENWPVLAERIKGNASLRGETRWPGATFDWVLNPTNLTKILEGNYKQDSGKSAYAEAASQLNERLDQDEKKLEGGWGDGDGKH